MSVKDNSTRQKVRWIPLEANPEVLNKFSAKLGMDTSKISFCDVWGLDEVGHPSKWLFKHQISISFRCFTQMLASYTISLEHINEVCRFLRVFVCQFATLPFWTLLSWSRGIRFSWVAMISVMEEADSALYNRIDFNLLFVLCLRSSHSIIQFKFTLNSVQSSLICSQQFPGSWTWERLCLPSSIIGQKPLKSSVVRAVKHYCHEAEKVVLNSFIIEKILWLDKQA